MKSTNFIGYFHGAFTLGKGWHCHWKIGRAFCKEDAGNTELLIVGSHAYWPGEMQEKTGAKVEPSGLSSTI